MRTQPRRRESPGRLGALVLLARVHPAASLAIIVGGSLALWFLAGWLYKSDRDQVLAALYAVRDGVVAGDADAVMREISPYFSEAGIDRQRLADSLPSTLAGKPVARAYIVPRRVEVQGATATVNATITTTHPGAVVRTEWLITLEKLQGRWLVRRATPVTLNGRDIPGLRSFLRLAD